MSHPAGPTRAPLLTAQLAQKILADLQVVVVQADADLTVLTHTPGLPEYLLEPGEELIGQWLPDLFPELFGSEEELAAVADGSSTRFELLMINRGHADRDDLRYFSLTARPHPEVEGTLILLVQDVTTEGRLDQKVMQQLNDVRLLRGQLQAANAELVRLDQEKSAFLRMAAHDLRAPLTVITGYVDLVMEDTDAAEDEEAMEYLEVVVRRTRQMTSLIDNLLDVEKIESGAVSLHLRPIDIGAMVEEMGKSFSPVADQQGLGLSWKVGPGLPQVAGDWDRLLQVVSNLVSNALKFTPQGGSVTIEAVERDDEIAVEVSDTGPGISEEDQARLFQRFFRTDDSRQKRIPGTGLGLSIVRAIIEQHGGRAYCRSQLGRGSTFGFSLPIGRET